MNLTAQDILIFKENSFSTSIIYNQIKKIKNGPKPIKIQRACTINDGIIKVDKNKHTLYSDYFKSHLPENKVILFIPASGAATRMFMHVSHPDKFPVAYHTFIDNIKKFAFFKELNIPPNATDAQIISSVLSPDGLNYDKLPKALITFHQYSNEVRKAIDDQLIEGLAYVNNNGICRFHFTISPEHNDQIKAHLNQMVPILEKKYHVQLRINISFQDSSTHTIALTEDNELVKKEDENILFRPGGHGSLLHNLNNIDADIVFIKNIDNIVIESLQLDIIKYKKILGGYLLLLQKDVFNILNSLDQNVDQNRLNEICNWVKTNLNITVTADIDAIRKALNRPIRICGVVEHKKGELGGGPFWINNSIQIVESAQLNISKPEVRKIRDLATHFNPVDMVCGLKNYRGDKFNLLNYRDDDTFFVSSKTYQGNEIKVLEHPGLWNGGMAGWLTVFIEVPIETFNPVKTVNELILPAHCTS